MVATAARIGEAAAVVAVAAISKAEEAETFVVTSAAVAAVVAEATSVAAEATSVVDEATFAVVVVTFAAVVVTFVAVAVTFVVVEAAVVGTTNAAGSAVVGAAAEATSVADIVAVVNTGAAVVGVVASVTVRRRRNLMQNTRCLKAALLKEVNIKDRTVVKVLTCREVTAPAAIAARRLTSNDGRHNPTHEGAVSAFALASARPRRTFRGEPPPMPTPTAAAAVLGEMCRLRLRTPNNAGREAVPNSRVRRENASARLKLLPNTLTRVRRRSVSANARRSLRKEKQNRMPMMVVRLPKSVLRRQYTRNRRKVRNLGPTISGPFVFKNEFIIQAEIFSLQDLNL